MKKYIFSIILLVIVNHLFAQSKFYIQPEIGLNSVVTSNLINQFTKPGLDLGLKVGFEFSENLSLETGFQWSQVQEFPFFNVYNISPDNGIETYLGDPNVSSNQFYSIPLHLKIGHDIGNSKFKIFTFWGSRFVFGNLNYTVATNITNNVISYENADVVSSIEIKPQFLLDGGLGLEYALTSSVSLIANASYSLGIKRLNGNFTAHYLNSVSDGSIYEDVKWKGDGLKASVGVKIRF